MKRVIPLYLYFILIILSGCHKTASDSYDPNLSDTLKVVTLYGPTSYFQYRGEEMGLDYENVMRFAKEEGKKIKISVAKSIPDLIDSLKNGNAQLAAYPVPLIGEYKSEVLHCGPREVTWQVLLQRKGKDMVTDVTQLIGKDVYVEKNSKFHFRLENLNEEIGGGINIITITPDSVVSDDIFDMVNDGRIDYAVVDSDIASLNQPDYPMLDTSLRLSLEQTSSWAVAPGLDSLALKLENWEKTTHESPTVKEIYKKYYDRGKYDTPAQNISLYLEKQKKGNVNSVPYIALFKKFAKQTGYDWNLLAAIAFCESRFDPTAQSRFGATGLMQVMPSSAKAVGVEPSALFDPETNLIAATRILKRMESALEDKISDKEERVKFLLASYNSGLGHIYDSMALAKSHGLDPEKWLGNVSVGVQMKARPEFYSDPVVKHGYFRGKETLEFVDNVIDAYNYLDNFNNKP